MRTATQNAQVDRLLDLIDAAARYSPPVAERLRYLANHYQYDTLLTLFEEG